MIRRSNVLVTVINTINNEQAKQCEKDTREKIHILDKEDKRSFAVFYWILAGFLCLIISGFSFLINVLDNHLVWYATLLICVGPILCATALFLLLYFGREERVVEFNDYPAKYRYWHFLKNSNLLEHIIETEISVSHSLYIVVENKDTHEVSKHYVTSFRPVYRTDIQAAIYDLEEGIVYLPYTDGMANIL